MITGDVDSLEFQVQEGSSPWSGSHEDKGNEVLASVQAPLESHL
jgi:hypothetical protein